MTSSLFMQKPAITPLFIIENASCTFRCPRALQDMYLQVVEPMVRAYLYTWGKGRTTIEGEHIPCRIEEMEIHHIDGMLVHTPAYRQEMLGCNSRLRRIKSFGCCRESWLVFTCLSLGLYSKQWVNAIQLQVSIKVCHEWVQPNEIACTLYTRHLQQAVSKT